MGHFCLFRPTGKCGRTLDSANGVAPLRGLNQYESRGGMAEAMPFQISPARALSTMLRADPRYRNKFRSWWLTSAGVRSQILGVHNVFLLKRWTKSYFVVCIWVRVRLFAGLGSVSFRV
jgi:hypothetical protein